MDQTINWQDKSLEETIDYLAMNLKFKYSTNPWYQTMVTSCNNTSTRRKRAISIIQVKFNQNPTKWYWLTFEELDKWPLPKTILRSAHIMAQDLNSVKYQSLHPSRPEPEPGSGCHCCPSWWCNQKILQEIPFVPNKVNNPPRCATLGDGGLGKPAM